MYHVLAMCSHFSSLHLANNFSTFVPANCLFMDSISSSFYLYRIELASNCNCSNAKEKERRVHYMVYYTHWFSLISSLDKQ